METLAELIEQHRAERAKRDADAAEQAEVIGRQAELIAVLTTKVEALEVMRLGTMRHLEQVRARRSGVGRTT